MVWEMNKNTNVIRKVRLPKLTKLSLNMTNIKVLPGTRVHKTGFCGVYNPPRMKHSPDKRFTQTCLLSDGVIRKQLRFQRLAQGQQLLGNGEGIYINFSTQLSHFVDRPSKDE